jgi:L-talarate/galactarate dehydratase
MQLRDGRMWVSDRPGLGFTLSEQAAAWTAATESFGRRP